MKLVITIKTKKGKVEERHEQYRLLREYARANGFEFEAKDEWLESLEDDDGEDE